MTPQTPAQTPTPGARETPAQHAATMRSRILDGAARAFAGSGFRATAMPTIAGEAGVSVGLIYRYFPSKEELFLAVCERETDATLDELAVTLGRIPDPIARLAAGVDQFVDSLDGSWGAIIVHAWAEADRNARVRAMLQRLFDQQRGFVAAFLREAIARGEMAPEVDIEAVSLAAGLLLHGAIAYQTERGAGFDPQLVRRAITTVLAAQVRRA